MPLHRLARWLERVNEHPVIRWAVTACVALPLILAVIVSTQYFNLAGQIKKDQRDRDAFTTCLASWADQYTARAERITRVNATTSNALAANIHALNVALADAIRKDAAALKRDVPIYQRAAAAYEAAAETARRATALDPIPDAPKFQCR